jgi:hypothetical protein
VKVMLDMLKQSSSDAAPLPARMNGDEVQVPHSIGERLGRVIRRADHGAVRCFGHDEVMVVQRPVKDPCDDVINEASAVDVEHLGIDRNALDGGNVHRLGVSDRHVGSRLSQWATISP